MELAWFPSSLYEFTICSQTWLLIWKTNDVYYDVYKAMTGFIQKNIWKKKKKSEIFVTGDTDLVNLGACWIRSIVSYSYIALND